MRTILLLLAGMSACAQPGGVSPPSAAAKPLASLAPWALRDAIQCLEWGNSFVAANAAAFVACEGVVLDRASGAITGFVPFDIYEVVGERGSAPVFRAEPGLVAYDPATGARTVFDEMGVRDASAVACRGDRCIAASVELYELAAGGAVEIDGGSRCQTALDLGIAADGVVQCIAECPAPSDDQCLHRREGTTWTAVRLPFRGSAAFLPDGGAIGATAEGVAVVDARGQIVETRSTGAHPKILDVSSDGDVLIASSSGVESWTADGERWTFPGTAHEAFAGPDAYVDGAFAGGEVLLEQGNRVFWFHRGPPRAPLHAQTIAIEGFDALRSTVDGDAPVFRDDEQGYDESRWPEDVAALIAPTDDREPGGSMRIAVSPRSRFARFTTDEALAQLLVQLYLPLSEERWARYWREGDDLVVQAHAYIGGCERTHHDVRFRLGPNDLERRTLYSQAAENRQRRLARARLVARALGTVPDDARELASVRSDRYAGDPSIGAVD